MKYLLCLTFVVASLGAIDLSTIGNEANLERRAHLALDHASESFAEAKVAYAAGNNEKTGAALLEMQKAVEIAHSALNETGKDPRRHVHPFKQAETETHDLLRHLEGLENSMDVDDRKLIEGPKAKVQEIHDEWLDGIISGRR
jgi:hypothetical protein